MSIQDNDSRVTAYALGELPRAEAEAFHEAILNDVALAAEEQEVRDLSDMLALGFGAPEHAGLRSDQRLAIYKSSTEDEDASVIAMSQKTQWRSYFIGLGSAAAVLCAMFLLLRDYVDRNSPKVLVGIDWNNISDASVLSRFSESDVPWEELAVVSSDIKSANSQIEKAIREEPRELRIESERRVREIGFDEFDLETKGESEWKEVKADSVVRLPLVCGIGSWSLLADAVERGLRPSPSDVRVEEVVNAVVYDSPTDVIIGGLSTGLEVVYSPWNEDHVVVSILLKSSVWQDGLQAGVSFGEGVERYRLVGYTEKNVATQASPAEVNAPEDYSHMVLYELDLRELDLKGESVITLHLKSSSEQFEETFVTSSFANKAWEDAGGNTRLALCLASWAQDILNSSDNMSYTKKSIKELPVDSLTGATKTVLEVIRAHLESLELNLTD